MIIILILLCVFWAFIFIAAGNKLYETLKYRDKVSLKDWLLIIAGIVTPIWFYTYKFFLNTP